MSHQTNSYRKKYHKLLLGELWIENRYLAEIFQIRHIFSLHTSSSSSSSSSQQPALRPCLVCWSSTVKLKLWRLSPSSTTTRLEYPVSTLMTTQRSWFLIDFNYAKKSVKPLYVSSDDHLPIWPLLAFYTQFSILACSHTSWVFF